MSMLAVSHLLAAQAGEGQQVVDELAHLVGIVLDEPQVSLALVIELGA